MNGRSGTGLVETAILTALDSLGARAGKRHVRNTNVLGEVEERIGLAPGYAYEVLLDLARPWVLPVSLVEGKGNYGNLRGDLAASFRYTESRLSPAGEVAVAADHGELAPVPIGLINGNSHRQGSRPPFRPEGIIAAAREAIARPEVTDRELAEMIGPPYFPTGSAVVGDIEALMAGRPAELRLQARVSVREDQRSVVIEAMPPGVDRGDVLASLSSRAKRHDWSGAYPDLDRATRVSIAEVQDVAGPDDDRFVCVAEPGAELDVLQDQIVDVHGIWAVIPVSLPQPLPAMVRRWVQAHAGEDLLASLARLEDAVARQR